MESVIIIDQSITVRRLNYIEPSHNIIEIKLLKSNDYKPGVLSSLIQYVLSNIIRNPNAEITISLEGISMNTIISNFHEYYHLLVITLFNKNASIKFSNKSITIKSLFEKFVEKIKLQEELYSREIDFKSDANNPNKFVDQLRKQFFAPKSKKLNDGISFLIPCFDHLIDEELNTSAYFYENENKIKDAEQIEIWLYRIFDFNIKELKIELFKKVNLIKEMSILIKELYENTHDWARTSFSNEKIEYSFRGCLINIYLNHHIEKSIDDYDPINGYIQSVLISENDKIVKPNTQLDIFNNLKRRIGFVEISILDTGSGLASRKLEKDYPNISIHEEHSTIVQCFNKHITSDTSGKRNIRGQGLSKVLEIIGMNGFLRMRTGRSYLTRNFLIQNLKETEIRNESLEFKIEEQPLQEGSLITILYPFIY